MSTTNEQVRNVIRKTRRSEESGAVGAEHEREVLTEVESGAEGEDSSIKSKLKRVESFETYDGIDVFEPTSAPDDLEMISKYADELMYLEREPVDEDILLGDLRAQGALTRPLPIITNLVLAGAGGRGFIYTGVALSLDKHGILDTLKRIVGTSCGAIIGSALALGYRGQDIIDILINTDFGKFKHELPRTATEKVVTFFTGQAIGKIFSLLAYRRGIYSGEGAENWLEFMVYAATGNKDITFGELRELAKTNLAIKEIYIVATNITDGVETVFSHIDTPNVRIVDAVLASMSLPGVFLPHRIEIDGQVKEFIDGGMVDEFPSSLTDIIDFAEEGLSENGANLSTLGFRIDEKVRGFNILHHHKKVSAGEYSGSATEWLQRIKLAAQQARSDKETYEKHSMTTVVMSDLGAKTLDFEATPERKKEMATHGCSCTDKYLSLYRGCGTYLKVEKRCPDRIEKQYDATEKELTDEYHIVHDQYVSDLSLDIVRKEYLIQRLKEILLRIETTFPESKFLIDLREKHECLEKLQQEHRERFEEARERMVEQRISIRRRMDVFSSRGGFISQELENIVRENNIERFRFLFSRDNAWASEDAFLNLKDVPVKSCMGGNLAFLSAYVGSETMLVRLYQIFGPEYFIRPGPNGLTSIHASILSDNERFLTSLLNKVNFNSEYALYAIMHGKVKLAMRIISMADKDDILAVNSNNGKNILHLLFEDKLIDRDSIAEIIDLICKRDPVNLIHLLSQQDSDLETPMHYLCKEARFGIFSSLLSFINTYKLAVSQEKIIEVLQLEVKNGEGSTPVDVINEMSDVSPEHNLFRVRINSLVENERTRATIGRKHSISRTVSDSSIPLVNPQLQSDDLDPDILLEMTTGAKIQVRKHLAR